MDGCLWMALDETLDGILFIVHVINFNGLGGSRLLFGVFCTVFYGKKMYIEIYFMCMYSLPFSVCQERREWSSSNPYTIPKPVLSLPNSYGHRRTCMVVLEPISSSSNV